MHYQLIIVSEAYRVSQPYQFMVIFPIYFYSRDYNEGAPGFGFLHDLWREIALPCNEQERDTSFQRRQYNLAVQGPIKTASLPLLKQYKPEDISLDFDGENIILHGQNRSEGEDGFENNEFKKIIKLPDPV